MHRWTEIARASAMTALAVAGVFLCLLLYQAERLVYQTRSYEFSLVSDIDQTLQNINRKCPTGSNPEPCGALADVAKTLNTVRGTFGQIEVAANHENRNLTTLDAQEQKLFADVTTTLGAGRAAAASLTDTAQQATADLQTLNFLTQEAQPLVSDLDDTVRASTKTLAEVNEILASPDLAATEKHVLSISASTDKMMDITAQVEEKATHDYLHPSKSASARIWQAIKPFLVPTIQIGGAVAVATMK